MTENVGTYIIGLDTPIHLLTPRQLFAMQKEWIEENPREVKPSAEKTERWYVNSIAELAKILGTSVPTLYRMKHDGLLDEAISQYGRWMCIDVNKVIETFKLSNRFKRKRKS